MAQYTTLIRVTPPDSYRWLVIQEGKTVASGLASSDYEARQAAERAIQRLDNPDPPSAG